MKAGRRRIHCRRIPASILGLFPLMAGLGLWEFLGDPNDLVFPSPSGWMSSLGAMHERGELIPAFVQTLTVYGASLFVVGVVGTGVGIVIGRSTYVERGIRPLIEFARSVPPPVAIPIVALVLGFNWVVGVASVSVMAIWFILLNVIHSVRAIPETRTEVGAVLALGRWRSWRDVLLPSVVPAVMVSFRQLMSVALLATLVVDVFGLQAGVGRLIVVRQGLFDASGVWGLVLVIGLFGYAMNVLMALAQSQVRARWGQSM